jgi:hypothetical protein
MTKYHKYISFAIGLAFSLILQIFSSPQPIFRILLPVFLFYVLLVNFYNTKYLKKIERYNFWVLLKIILLLINGFGIYMLVPTAFFRSVFLVVSIFVIMFFELLLENHAENVLINLTLISACGMFFSLAAFWQFFPSFRFYAIAGSFFAASLLARSFYEFVPQPQNIKNFSAVFLGLFSVEFFWSLTFLPFHFSILGLLLFNFFYFCAIINYYYFFNTLSLKKLQFHFSLAAITSALVLLVTPWKP